MMRVRTPAMSVAILCCAALSLTACGGGDDTAEAGSTASSGASTPSEAASSTGSGDVSATSLCEYLRGEVADLRAIGSEVGAMANLTVNLFSWYDEQGTVPDGSEIDGLTQQECPDVRSEVLEIAGIESFAAL